MTDHNSEQREKTVWELKASSHEWPCAICGKTVDSLHLMKGRFMLCTTHSTWRGYLAAWAYLLTKRRAR
jgi:hypothetical protein